jgi:hypothetical protein
VAYRGFLYFGKGGHGNHRNKAAGKGDYLGDWGMMKIENPFCKLLKIF